MAQGYDFDRRLRARLRQERLWLLRKSADTLRRSERNPYSQVAVAERIGVVGSTLRDWERGRGKPSLDHWDTWCVAVRQDLAALLVELFRNVPE